MGALDTFFADTVGVVYRAGTGNVDPWTKQEIIDQATAERVQASNGALSESDARAQVEQEVTDALKGFSLGGGDRVGADPSQSALSLPSLQALKDAAQSATNDNGTGCGITNLGGCIQIPSWAWWAIGGLGVLAVLYVLGPYVGLIGRTRQ